MEPTTIRVAKWTRGAYSREPVVSNADGKFVVNASIDCWRGTADELAAAISVVADAFPGEAPEILIVSAGGRAVTVRSSDLIAAELEQFDHSDLLLVRAMLLSSDGQQASAIIIGGKKVPGIRIRVESSDRARAMGVAEVAFRELMVGYVDRMGSFRGLAWELLALSPVVLVSLLVGPLINPGWLRLVVVLAVSVLAVAVMAASYRFLLVSNPLVVVNKLPDRDKRQWRERVVTLYRHRWTKPVLAAIFAVALGIIGNKISDLIKWPW